MNIQTQDLSRQAIDNKKRSTSFRSQFGTYPEYEIPDGYFELNGKSMAQFDRDSNKILDKISKMTLPSMNNRTSVLVKVAYYRKTTTRLK